MWSTNTNQTTVDELQSKTFAIKPGILGRALGKPNFLLSLPLTPGATGVPELGGDKSVLGGGRTEEGCGEIHGSPQSTGGGARGWLGWAGTAGILEGVGAHSMSKG